MSELTKVIEITGIESTTGAYIKEQFLPFFEQAEEWKKKAETLVVTDESQTSEMKMAREARLALKGIRVEANKTRKALKEESLRYGRAVQGVYNVIEYLISPIEKHLEQQEKFAEIQEAKRIAKLKAAREVELQPFIDFAPYGIDLGNMSEEDYQKLLNGARLQFQSKIEAEEKAEAERVAKAKAEAEERERIRAENERLRAEAEAREKQIAEERARVEAERKALEEAARKEQEAREAVAANERAKVEAELKAKEVARLKLEEELRVKAEAEAKAKAAEAEAKRKAAAAPDKEKLIALVQTIEGIEFPAMQDRTARNVLNEFKNSLHGAVDRMSERIESEL